MGGLRILVTLVCVAGLGRSQLQFPGASEDSKTTSDLPAQASPPSASNSTPNNPNTRFLPGLEALDVFGLFDPCKRCSFNDQRLANQCCQTGKRECCVFLQAVGPISPFGPVGPQFQGQFPGQFQGQFPGQFQGQFPGQFQSQFPGQSQSQFSGQFPGVVGPPGFQGGFGQTNNIKPGFCPKPGLFGGLFGLRSGANGAPGSTRTGAADTLEGDEAVTGPDTNEAKELRRALRKQQRREERLAQLQEGERTRRSPQDNSQDNRDTPRRENKDDQRERRLNRLGRVFDRTTRNAPEELFARSKRSPQQSHDDFRERRLNRFERVFDRVTRDTPKDATRFRRSPQRPGQDDFRERRLNRFERIFDRTVRDASEDDDVRVRRSPQRDSQDDRRERRRNRFERVFGRVTREAAEHEVSHKRLVRQAPRDEPTDAEPDTRFFLPKLPNIFCRDECFNDFDCPGNLKCCSKDDCRSCVNPSFF